MMPAFVQTKAGFFGTVYKGLQVGNNKTIGK